MFGYETAFTTTQHHHFCDTLIHRRTGIKVYSSDMNTVVYGSDQYRANHLIKVRWSFKRCL